jgi:hypothetical protein
VRQLHQTMSSVVWHLSLLPRTKHHVSLLSIKDSRTSKEIWRRKYCMLILHTYYDIVNDFISWIYHICSKVYRHYFILIHFILRQSGREGCHTEALCRSWKRRGHTKALSSQINSFRMFENRVFRKYSGLKDRK